MKRLFTHLKIASCLLVIGYLTGCGSSGAGSPALDSETSSETGASAVVSKSLNTALSAPSVVFSAFRGGGGTADFSNKTSANAIQKIKAGARAFVASLHETSPGHGEGPTSNTRACSEEIEESGTETTVFDFETGVGTTERVNCVLGDELHNTTLSIETREAQDCSDIPFLGNMPKTVQVISNGTIDVGTERTTLSGLQMLVRFSCNDFNFQGTGAIVLDSSLESGSISVTDSAAPADDIRMTFESMNVEGFFTETEDAIKINGNVSIALNCSGTATESSFSLTTNAPIMTPPGDNTACPIRGSITLSGEINTTITHNADGSVDVGDRHFDSCKELDAICET